MALISVGLLLHFGRERNPLATVNGVFRLVIIGLLGCVISATVGSSVLCVIGHSAWTQFPLIWLTWWAGFTLWGWWCSRRCCWLGAAKSNFQ
ncbi:MAG: hypothetical protein QM813_19865 [Verrucomicrobiota bacterium]